MQPIWFGKSLSMGPGTSTNERPLIRRLAACSCVAAIAVAAGCGGGGAGGGAGGPPQGFAVSVRTVEARQQALEEKLALVASVYANEVVDVKSEMNGTVAEVNFEEGRAVTNGQALVILDTRKLSASVAEAEANFNLAKANRDRAESMLANKTISRQEFDQAVAAFESRSAMLDLMKEQLRDATIRAPFSGVASARQVSPGQVIGRDNVLTRLVDLHPIKVEFRVPERLLGQLKVGQAISFHVTAYPGEDFRGEVYFIDPQVDPENRTVLVKALQPNADERLRPGMFGNLDLILRVKPAAIVVPERAVVADGDRTYLLLAGADGKAQRVPVTVGQRLAGVVEITEGLKGGEQVIVEGVQKVQPGMPVNASPADAEAGDVPAGTNTVAAAH